MQPSNAIQVGVALGDSTIPTTLVRRPVPAASPMPTWYSNHGLAYSSLRPPVISADQYITVGHGIVDPTPIYIHQIDHATETAPLWTLREGNHLNESEKMAIELHNLDQQINCLKMVSHKESTVESTKDDECLHHELRKVEQGIREKQTELKMEVYEWQVAHDIQEAEKRWLCEIEQEEQDWCEAGSIILEKKCEEHQVNGKVQVADGVKIESRKSKKK